tara:strand:+ start:2960 stop:3301 length:342 start_codon:yes stop_codon:yes gene_type:complete
MFINLSNDNIRDIANFLTLYDLINFKKTNKFIFLSFDEKYYEILANKIYGKNFWKIALERPYIISKPLNSYKKELLRIENFQIGLDKLNKKRWTNKDFYNYWKLNDKNNNKFC